MKEIIIKDDFIKLGQLLKLAGLVNNGAEAKILIESGKVLVNGEVTLMRGKKIKSGDITELNSEKVIVK